MKKIFSNLTILILLVSSTLLFAQNMKVDTSVFPKAQKGYEQFIIEVPHSSLEEDANKKIEIFVGKYMDVDTCNRHSLMGEFQSKDLQGWGYSYLEFKTKGDAISTMMGCLDNKTVSKFVTGQSYLTDYNGRMPIVIYVPEGYEVRYKIYQAMPEQFKALQTPKK